MHILRVHWRFLSIVVISFAFVLYARGQVSPVKEKAESGLRNARSTMNRYVSDVLSDVESYGAPANLAIVKRRSRRNALQELVQMQSSALTFQLASDYNIDVLGPEADDDTRADFYLRRLDALRNRLRYTRYWEPVIIAREGVAATVSYDFSLEGGSQASTLKQKLLRLDILRRVADAAQDWKVSRIEDLTFLADGGLQHFERRIPSAQRAARRDSSPLIRSVGITVQARGSQSALMAFMADLQRYENKSLVGRAFVLDQFKLWKEDWKEPEDQLLSLEATFAVCSVVPEAPLSERSLVAALARYDASLGATEDNVNQPDDPFGDGAGSSVRPTRRRR